MAITWKDVDELLKSEGLYMDDTERKILANDPETAYSVAKKKQLYKYAGSDSERAKINSDTDYLRNLSGYSMGKDGASYSKVATPSSFMSDYTDEVKNNYNSVKNYGDFTYDAFDDKYAGKRAELLDAIGNTGSFSYDYSDDPVYQSYAKQYRREGDRAVQNAIAQSAANTGGRASTAAVSAAAQAGNYYGAQLTDKIPELYDAAYNRWLDEFTLKQNALAAYQGETAADYDRYANERSFAKGVYDDKYARLLDSLNISAELEQSDYDRHKDDLTYVDDRRKQTLSEAWDAANVGDYRLLNDLGIDTSWYEAQQEEEAQRKREAALRDAETAERDGRLTEAQITNIMNGIELDNKNYRLNEREVALRELEALMDEVTDGRLLEAVKNYQNGKADSEDYDILMIMGYIDKNGQSIGTMMLSDNAVKTYDYDGVQDTRMLTREEWERAKALGNTSNSIAYFDSYDAYVQAYKQKLAE